MGWYGGMSGLGHEPPTFEEWNSRQGIPFEEGSTDYTFYQGRYENLYPARTKTFHYETDPHPWVAHHKTLPGFQEYLVNSGQLDAYKAMSTLSREEISVLFKLDGKTDYQINNWFRTGKFGSSEPAGWSDVGMALFFFVVLPTVLWNMPSSVPLSPRWFSKKVGL